MGSVTLAEVAQRAGVGYGTASRAVNGRGKVSAAARERVERAAAEMGFKVNAAASLLARQKRPEATGLRLAIVWRSGQWEEEATEAIWARQGVEVQMVVPMEFGSPGELLRVLWARGYQGLYVNFNGWPWSADVTERADWSRFSVVKFGRLMPGLTFHTVRHSAFDYLHSSLEQVMQRGYQRVAVLLFESGSEVDDRARLGATLAAAEVWGSRGRQILWRRWGGNDLRSPEAATLEWLRAVAPEAILAYHTAQVEVLEAAGWRFPRDAGIAAVVNWPRRTGAVPGNRISGNAPGFAQGLEVGIAFLKELIGRNERGPAALPTELVIEPCWCEGDSL
jgi:DNA-binding LacI/PurR family transcriptional regulator